MNDANFSGLEKLFMALCDKTRLRLLSLMAGGEVSVNFLAESLDESQPKVSRHLAYLRSAGVVTTRREGKWIFYGIADMPDAAQNEILRSAVGSAVGIASSSGSQSTTKTKAENPCPRPPRRNIYAKQYMIMNENLSETSDENNIYKQNIYDDEPMRDADFAREEMDVFLL